MISFDKLCRESIQDNVIDKNEYESLCKIFTRFVDETKKVNFFKYEHKNKYRTPQI